MFYIDVTMKTIPKDLQSSVVKRVTAPTREEVEEKAETIVETIYNFGYLNDDSPNDWYFIPSHSIAHVRLEFGEIEEDEQRENRSSGSTEATSGSEE